MRVEQIEDDYANFKKRQMKIFWWLQLVTVKIMISKSMKNFVQWQHIVTMNRLKKMKKNISVDGFAKKIMK